MLPILPDSLTHLTFGEYFNRAVDNLPPGLTHLTFVSAFNKAVDNLPQSLVELTFGDSFNQPVDSLPPSLKLLRFGLMFNQPVDNLPKTLTLLELREAFDQPINNIPKTITTLRILSMGYCKPITTLPNLLHFQVGMQIEGHFEQASVVKAKLPDSLITVAGNFFTLEMLQNLPPNLQKIISWVNSTSHTRCGC